MASRKKFSTFEYSYRDASNYYVHGFLILSGTCKKKDKEKIFATLQDHIFFVPEHISLPPLQGELYAYTGGPTDDDHPLHEFLDLRPAMPEEIDMKPVFCSVKEMVKRFTDVTDWQSWRYDPIRKLGAPWQ